MTPDNLVTLAIKAKNALEALEMDRKNASLIEDMKRAGRELHAFGDFEAMSAALEAFYPDDEAKTHRAGIILNAVWDGIGSWRR